MDGQYWMHTVWQSAVSSIGTIVLDTAQMVNTNYFYARLSFYICHDVLDKYNGRLFSTAYRVDGTLLSCIIEYQSESRSMTDLFR